jgi:Ca2+-binding RTX toxin-like protein
MSTTVTDPGEWKGYLEKGLSLIDTFQEVTEKEFLSRINQAKRQVAEGQIRLGKADKFKQEALLRHLDDPQTLTALRESFESLQAGISSSIAATQSEANSAENLKIALKGIALFSPVGHFITAAQIDDAADSGDPSLLGASIIKSIAGVFTGLATGWVLGSVSVGFAPALAIVSAVAISGYIVDSIIDSEVVDEEWKIFTGELAYDIFFYVEEFFDIKFVDAEHPLDTLAVTGMLETLDPTFGQYELDRLFETTERNLTHTLERITNAIGDLVGAGQEAPLHNRAALADRLDAIQAEVGDGQGGLKPQFRGLKIDVFSTNPQTVLDAASGASGDALAYRYALLHLNPFAVTGNPEMYAPHNGAGELDLYDPDTGKGTLTTDYLQDRADFLGKMMTINSIGEGLFGPALQEFRDLETDLLVSVQHPGPGPSQRRIFGTEGNDTLNQAGDSEDHLYGMAGDDLLDGRGGADLMEGGAGDDTYVAGDGDRILDTDGIGRVLIGERVLYGGTRPAGDAQAAYVDEGSGISYRLQGRVLTVTAPEGTFTVEGFTPGDLGITLAETEPVPDPATIREGTESDDQLIGGNEPTAWDGLGGSDWFLGGDGADRVHGGADDDKLEGADGDDLLVGGHGGDILLGGNGDDRLYIDDEIGDLPSFVTQSADAAGSGERGGWASGGLGQDTLVGGDGNDVLQGGGGTDLILGGPGDDVIDGDNDYKPTDFDWTVSPVANPFDVSLDPVLSPGDTRKFGAEDIIHAGSGADIVVAGMGNDAVFGESGDDRLSGGDGDDYLSGGAGDDWLTGEWGSPIPLELQAITVAGNDVLDGGPGNDRLWGEDGDDRLLGGDGDDELLGQQGDDSLDGGAGADLLVGGAGADRLQGGADDDTLSGDASDVDPAQQGNDILDGGPGNDALYGFHGDDRLLGGDGADELQGGGGNDALYGGNGDDNLVGAAGTDALFGEDGDDILVGDATNIDGAAHGDDFLDGGAGRDQLYGLDGADTLRGGEDDDELQGNAGDDVLHGDAGADLLVGADGADRLYGGSGDDTLGGDADNADPALHGNDFLDGGPGNDRLLGHGGTDSLHGGDGADVLNGGADDDLLHGDGGDDRLFGDDTTLPLDRHGSDILVGGAGNDQLSGGGGNDELHGDSGDDDLVGDQGDDALYGGDGADALSGGVGNDRLYGGDGTDTLTGGAGDDRLYGGPGADLLDGGRGNDTMAGGDGHDIYRYRRGDGVLTIVDQGDNTLRFDFGSREADFHLSLGSLKIDFGGGDEIHLEGFDPTNPSRSAGITRFEFIDGTMTHEQLVQRGFDLQGTPEADVIVGTGGDDRILGLAGDDAITGGNGNDTLDGGPGADLMEGGSGDDTFHVDDPGDHAVEQAGAGRDRVIASLDYELGEHLEDLELTGGALTGGGNDLDNHLRGNAQGNTLSGGAGSDHLEGMGGDDRLEGGAGDDVLAGDAGDDRLDGGSGADRMVGGFGDDQYVVDDAGDRVLDHGGDGPTYSHPPGLGGDDTVISSVSFIMPANIETLILSGNAPVDGVGSVAQNRIEGNDADNNLYAHGLDGSLSVKTAAMNDTVPYDGVLERLLERFALSRLQGDIPQGEPDPSRTMEFTVTPGPGDTLVGNGGDDRLFGGLDDDTLIGGAGDDLLVAFGGTDRLLGGEGNDTYVLTGPIRDRYDFADITLIYNDSAAVVLEEAQDQGTDQVLSTVSFTLPPFIENLQLLDDTGAFDQDMAVYGQPLRRVATAEWAIGNELDNRIIANDAGIRMEGRDGDDLLIGGQGDDTLIGGAGADDLRGGHGNDRYLLDDALDSIVEGDDAGRDTVESPLDQSLPDNVEDLVLTGSAAVDGTGNGLANQLQGNTGANTLRGAAGNDRLYGGAGDDSLFGGDGDDLLEGGEGTDTMDGGAGDDRYNVQDSADRLLERPGEGYDSVHASTSFTLPDHLEDLYLEGGEAIDGNGNGAANRLYGNTAANRLHGRGGDDTLDGGMGADSLFGGTGDDLYVVDDPGDSVTENADEGSDRVISSVSHTLSTNVENLTLAGEGDTNGAGNTADNRLVGNDYRNRLEGLEGADYLDGAGDHDHLLGGDGDDVLYGGDDAVLWRDQPFATPRIVGIFVPNECYVTGNDDILEGGAGNDHLDGGSGNDLLQGGDGDDTLYGGDEGLTWDACGGGGSGYVNGNDDELYGGAGVDLLEGGSGDDLLDGGTGLDTLRGGTGNDIYYVDGHYEFIDGDGSGGDLSSGKGNEGVGNGEDPPPPGHDENMNDCPGTSPGNPGASSGLCDQAGQDPADTDPASATGTLDQLSNSAARILWHVDTVIEAADAGHDIVYSSATFTLTDHVEELHLLGSDAIDGSGNTLDNLLEGNAGNNRLDGAQGADRMLGGAGDDFYLVDNVGDQVVELHNEGDDEVASLIDYVLAPDVEHLALLGTAGIGGAGNDGANRITGNGAANHLRGLGGDDVLRGGGGDDLLEGGAGNDSYLFDAGDGLDRIADREGVNRVLFGDDIHRGDLEAWTTTDDGVLVAHLRLRDPGGDTGTAQGLDIELDDEVQAGSWDLLLANDKRLQLDDLLKPSSRPRSRRVPGAPDGIREDTGGTLQPLNDALPMHWQNLRQRLVAHLEDSEAPSGDADAGLFVRPFDRGAASGAPASLPMNREPGTGFPAAGW